MVAETDVTASQMKRLVPSLANFLKQSLCGRADVSMLNYCEKVDGVKRVNYVISKQPVKLRQSR